MDEARDLERVDLEATLEARRELGPEYEPALVEAFADRVEQVIEARVDASLAAAEQRRTDEKARSGRQFAMGISSLALGIPLTAIAGGIADVTGIAVAWAGIALVNASYAWQNRDRSRGSRRA